MKILGGWKFWTDENFAGGAIKIRSRTAMPTCEQSEPSRAIQFSARRSASGAEPSLVAHEREGVSARSYARNARLARNIARFRSARCQPCLRRIYNLLHRSSVDIVPLLYPIRSASWSIRISRVRSLITDTLEIWDMIILMDNGIWFQIIQPSQSHDCPIG